jgi:hypothetical protein
LNIQEIAMSAASAAPAAQVPAVSDEPVAVCINVFSHAPPQCADRPYIGKTQGKNHFQCEIGIL